jgi:hypothetical protein
MIAGHWMRSTLWPSIHDMSNTRPAWLVKGVAVVGEHKLRLLFEDGTVGEPLYEAARAHALTAA